MAKYFLASLAFSALVVPNSAFAVLSPYYESAREIKAVMESQQVLDELGDATAIETIHRNGNGYEVVAGKCSMQVNIDYVPRTDGLIGPAQFEIHPDQVTCQP